MAKRQTRDRSEQLATIATLLGVPEIVTIAQLKRDFTAQIPSHLLAKDLRSEKHLKGIASWLETGDYPTAKRPPIPPELVFNIHLQIKSATNGGFQAAAIARRLKDTLGFEPSRQAIHKIRNKNPEFKW
jgi:hypothetical protein